MKVFSNLNKTNSTNHRQYKCNVNLFHIILLEFQAYLVCRNLVYPGSKKDNFHSDLPILPERIKIEKVKKFVANLYDKTEYFIHK